MLWFRYDRWDRYDRCNCCTSNFYLIVAIVDDPCRSRRQTMILSQRLLSVAGIVGDRWQKGKFVPILSLWSLNTLLAIPAIMNDQQQSCGNQAFCNCRVSLPIFFSSVTRHCETKTFEIFCLLILFFQQQTGSSSIKLKYLVYNSMFINSVPCTVAAKYYY